MFRSHVSRHLLAAALAMVGSAAVHAAVITYDESVNGDLNSGSSIGTLGLGTNTVSGNIALTNGSIAGIPESIDADPFSFAVPPGAVLEQVSYDFRFTRTRLETMASVTYAIDEVPFGIGIASLYINLLTESSPVSVSAFGSVLPLGPGDYAMINIPFVLCTTSPFPCGWEADYVWRLTVRQAVPEPASLALVVIALLAGLGGRAARGTGDSPGTRSLSRRLRAAVGTRSLRQRGSR